jgi:hypothetical protein
VFSGVFRFFLVSGKSFFIVAVTKSFRGRVFVFFFLFPVTATLFFLFCEERESHSLLFSPILCFLFCICVLTCMYVPLRCVHCGRAGILKILFFCSARDPRWLVDAAQIKIPRADRSGFPGIFGPL